LDAFYGAFNRLPADSLLPGRADSLLPGHKAAQEANREEVIDVRGGHTIFQIGWL
jgi:hypothetical protein